MGIASADAVASSEIADTAAHSADFNGAEVWSSFIRHPPHGLFET
jgi:hypothetical protein